mmetsp:Transcript_132120/g.232810  ORF Transcript_132120/g.232810 Transcript_132120/m.232810 type:complete len:93 (-) Transcript_132120:27-305(-)
MQMLASHVLTLLLFFPKVLALLACGPRASTSLALNYDISGQEPYQEPDKDPQPHQREAQELRARSPYPKSMMVAGVAAAHKYAGVVGLAKHP